MYAQIMGFPTGLGMPRKVPQYAPTVLRRLGLIDAIGGIVDVVDLGDLFPESAAVTDGVERRLSKVLQAARHQARAFTGAYEIDSLPITLGGDHTTSLGTVLALNQLGMPFDIVWLDAHGDFNTPTTSPTGNPHGMVLALLAGLTRYLPQIIEPSRLHLWGVRDLDPKEKCLLEAIGVDVRDVSAIRTEPDLLRGVDSNVLLSFDCDCCEPDVAPGTMTPVAGGFEREEILHVVRNIAESRRILAMDVVELHPDRDFQNRTAKLALEVIATAVRAQVGSQRWTATQRLTRDQDVVTWSA